jgi:glycosyltransferase involved in cell wall biosynthesis
MFLVCEPNSDNKKDNPIGVIKKIYGQIETLNNIDSISCIMINLPSTRWRYIFNLYKNILNDERGIDFIYARRIMPVNKALLALLKKIKDNNPSCKILYEIPTYPYDKEHKTFLSKCGLFVDKLYRNRLKNYIDKVVTMTDDDIIFGMSTIKMQNGIICADIPVRKPMNMPSTLHCIAVAQFSFYHGYERLIAGLSNYYKNKRIDKVYIHFVGDGYEIAKYKAMVRKYDLEEYCSFYGTLYGEELTNVFNKCNLGICTLGAHRCGIKSGSFLKSREYLARGLPIVSSTKIDIIPDGFEYCLYVSEDESPIDITKIINYCNDIYQGNDEMEIIKKIRNFAEENCDMKKTMKPVIEYLTGL